MKNLIELKFADKTVPSLAGYEFGETVYKEQVSDKIDFGSDEIIIVFPEHKTVIASSFIEGFFDGIKEKIGISGIHKKIKIVSKSDDLISDIYESLK